MNGDTPELELCLGQCSNDLTTKVRPEIGRSMCASCRIGSCSLRIRVVEVALLLKSYIKIMYLSHGSGICHQFNRLIVATY